MITKGGAGRQLGVAAGPPAIRCDRCGARPKAPLVDRYALPDDDAARVQGWLVWESGEDDGCHAALVVLCRKHRGDRTSSHYRPL
jgi:hypothetical protein